MNTRQPWYNAERVAQPGSVILARAASDLAQSNAERRARLGVAQNSATGVTYDSSTGTRGSELYQWMTGGMASAGVAVNERSAMAVTAVYACVALISGAIASLPLPVYRRTDSGRERADHPVWWKLNEQPHPDVSAAVFWEYVATANLLYGDAFAEIVRPRPGTNDVKWFRLHHPRAVVPLRLADDMGLAYDVYDADGTSRRVLGMDMLHFPGLGFDGRRSLSPIRAAGRNAVGIALAADEWSASFFANGARPDFALSTAGTLKSEQIESLRTQWAERHAGPLNRGKPVIMQGGLDVKTLTIPAEDAQLIETRKMQVEEVARLFGVPPHMIGHTDKGTSWGTGIEQQAIGFVRFTLQRHLVRIEQELNRKLWPIGERFFVEFNVAGLERGDYKTRNEGYRIALGRAGEPGWMTVNEIRKTENLAPIDGGDKLNDGRKDNAPAATPADQ